jgi:hypothetical protein
MTMFFAIALAHGLGRRESAHRVADRVVNSQASNRTSGALRIAAPRHEMAPNSLNQSVFEDNYKV